METESRETTAPQPGKSATGEFWRVFRRLGATGPLALIAIVFPAVNGTLLLVYLDPVSKWFQSHAEAGVLLYMVLFAIMGGLALLPTHTIILLGGWAFGMTIGLPAALFGFNGGALIGYFVGRRAAGQRVVDVISENPKWQAIYDALLGGGFWKTLGYVTLLRLPPNSPFAMTNLVMAATRVPLGAYVLGTFFGMLPRATVVIALGAGLENLADADKPWWMFVVTIVLTIIILVVLAKVANRAIAKATGVEHPTPSVVPATDRT